MRRDWKPLRYDRFDAWFAGFEAQTVALIFPSAFMNNPASMFGHTFLGSISVGRLKHPHPGLHHQLRRGCFLKMRAWPIRFAGFSGV